MDSMKQFLEQIDWALLAEQKLALLQIEDNKHVDGLVNFLDGFQDAAELEGYPVVWLSEEEES